MKSMSTLYVFALAVLGGSGGCGNNDHHQVRVYTEQTSVQAGDPAMMSPSGPTAAAASLHWSKPDHWQEQAGSGFRLVTFVVENGGQKGECVISQLGPEGGAPLPNLTRWLGQLNVQGVAPSDLQAFIDAAPHLPTGLGTEAVVFDLASFATEQSMLAAIIRTPVKTYFVKLTGTKALIAGEKAAFESLTSSLEVP